MMTGPEMECYIRRIMSRVLIEFRVSVEKYI